MKRVARRYGPVGNTGGAPDRDSLRRLRWLNISAAVLHAGGVCATATVANLSLGVRLFMQENSVVIPQSNGTDVAGAGPLIRTVRDFLVAHTRARPRAHAHAGRFTFMPMFRELSVVLPVSLLVLWQFAVTASFHCAYAVFGGEDGAYARHVSSGNQSARWVEYSLSAPAMVVLVAISTGERGVTTLLTIAILTSLTQLCGHLSERANRQRAGSERRPGLGWPFLCGVGMQTIVWALILQRFVSTVSAGTGKPPDFVYAIVACEVVLFCSFAAVHVWHTHAAAVRPAQTAHVKAEVFYIILSFASKAVLGGVLLYFVLGLERFEDGVT